jgi:hypothetical protein
MRLLNNVGIFLTLFTFLKDWKDVVNFVAQNLASAGLVLVALAALFTWELVSTRRRTKPPRGEAAPSRRLRRLFPSSWSPRRMRGWALLRAALTTLALAVVGFLVVRVYVAGVYYVQLESSTDAAAVAARVDQLNGFLDAAGETTLRVKAQAPLGANRNYAITVGGPIFSAEEAARTFVRVKEVLGERLRPEDEAGVKRVTFGKVLTRLGGMLGMS